MWDKCEQVINRRRYENTIQLTRIAAAMLGGLGCIGVMVCANLSFEIGVFGFLLFILISLALVICLILEQLAFVWLATSGGRISLAGLLLLTSVACLFFALYRNSTGLAIVFLAFLISIIAASVESRRRPRKGAADRAA